MERANYRYLWIGLGILALLALVALPAWGGGMMGYGYGYGFHPFGGPWFWGVGLVFRVLIWGAILFFVFGLFRRRWSRRYEDFSEPTSEEILNRRYAAGEITREQYEEMRQVLEAKKG